MEMILKVYIFYFLGLVIALFLMEIVPIIIEHIKTTKEIAEWKRRAKAGEYVERKFHEWCIDAQKSRHEEEMNSAYWRIKGLEAEIDHLKRSKFIKSFMLLDENDNYVRDIREADKITGYDKEVPEEYDVM